MVEGLIDCEYRTAPPAPGRYLFWQRFEAVAIGILRTPKGSSYCCALAWGRVSIVAPLQCERYDIRVCCVHQGIGRNQGGIGWDRSIGPGP